MAFFGEPQWAVVGDTFPVGCKPQVSFSRDSSHIQGVPRNMTVGE